jgi:phage terminase large subunit-like protein
MEEGRALVRRLEALAPEERANVLEAIAEARLRAFNADWPGWAHEGQIPPDEDWHIWVLLAGRGFGKTRAGAEHVSGFARAAPDARIALVAATPEEARRVMVEGRSGLIAVARPGEERGRLIWEPSLGRLVFASGAEAQVFSGANPDALRGPEHHFGWCDELAKWRRAEATWDNLMLGLRAGTRPRALVTTTPKPVAALKRILGMEGTVLCGGATRANPHLPEAFIRAVEAAHAGTRFGRQELEGELIETVEGALWTRELIEESLGGDGRFPHGGAESHAAARESDCPLVRVVVGVDPPASADGDACGIVVAGLGADGVGYVLADLSVAGLSPEGWARKVAAAAEAWAADRVVAEANNGGDMVASVLRGAGLRLGVTKVHAASGKSARAEPVAALFESRRAKFAGRFPALEDELCGLTVAGGYEGPGRSPDRADAMVWALWELLLGPQKAPPAVRSL